MTLFENKTDFKMEKPVELRNLPYVARTYWFLRWGLLLGLFAIYVVLIVNYSEFIESLRQSNELIIAGFLLMFLVWFPLTLISTFFSKTVFDENHIEHTSQLLIKKKWLYEDIEKVERSNKGHIRITFADGRSIKVWSGEANLNFVLSLIRIKTVDLRS